MVFDAKKILLCAVCVLATAESFAHGAWLAERAGEPTVVYGHGNHDDEYKPSKVTVVKGFDDNNRAVDIKKIPAERNVSLKLPKKTAYLGFVFDNGYWTKNKKGKWKNVPKTQVSDADMGGHYIKNAIYVVNSDANVKPIDALQLQIVPLENPLEKEAGDKLPILVLFKGKPLSDAKIVRDFVNMSHEDDVETDSKGKATIVIRNQGLNVIGVSYTEELDNDPKADENGFTSTLSFTLEHLDDH